MHAFAIELYTFDNKRERGSDRNTSARMLVAFGELCILTLYILVSWKTKKILMKCSTMLQ